MYIFGRNSVIEALESDNKISTIYVGANSKEGSIKKIHSIACQKKIIIKVVDKKKLDTLSENQNHQGVVALVDEYEYYEFNDLLKDIKAKKENGEKSNILILDNIEDPHNFGSIIRSALGANFDGIIIQNRRSVQVTPTVIKVSSGTASKMKICKVVNLSNAIEDLKEIGMWVYALDMSGEDLHKIDLTADVVLVLGNEGKGVSEKIKKSSDFMMKIPTNPALESLNVSVAAAISMFEVARQKGF